MTGRYFGLKINEADISVINVTEAKVAALQNLDIISPVSNQPATGTGTDSIAIAADSKAKKIQYCGKHVVFGEILARLVIEAVISSIDGKENKAFDAAG
jgi:adenosylcobinamide amidohydrolase